MKEIEPIHKDTVVNVSEKPVEHKKELIKTVQIKRGHSMYMINKDTLETKLATYDEIAVNFEDAVNGVISTKKALTIIDGWWYVSALNKRNALKRFLKHISHA
jgi:hypothetical protein